LSKPYPDFDKWIEAGRKIEGADEGIIRLYEDGEVPVDLDDELMCMILSYIGSPDSVAFLIRILEDANKGEPERSRAAMALGDIGDPRAIEPLRRIAAKPEHDGRAKPPASLRVSAMGALCFLRDPWVIPVAEDALTTLELPNIDRVFLHGLLEDLKRELKGE
jgi:HEAT repeat protein